MNPDPNPLQEVCEQEVPPPSAALSSRDPEASGRFDIDRFVEDE